MASSAGGAVTEFGEEPKLSSFVTGRSGDTMREKGQVRSRQPASQSMEEVRCFHHAFGP
jgi:hypothetical protein